MGMAKKREEERKRELRKLRAAKKRREQTIAFKAEIADLKDQLANTAASRAKADSAVTALRSTVGQQEDQIRKLKSTVNSQEDDIARFESQATSHMSTKVELDSLRRSFENLQESHIKLQFAHYGKHLYETPPTIGDVVYLPPSDFGMGVQRGMVVLEHLGSDQIGIVYPAVGLWAATSEGPMPKIFWCNRQAEYHLTEASAAGGSSVPAVKEQPNEMPPAEVCRDTFAPDDGYAASRAAAGCST